MLGASNAHCLYMEISLFYLHILMETKNFVFFCQKLHLLSMHPHRKDFLQRWPQSVRKKILFDIWQSVSTVVTCASVRWCLLSIIFPSRVSALTQSGTAVLHYKMYINRLLTFFILFWQAVCTAHLRRAGIPAGRWLSSVATWNGTIPIWNAGRRRFSGGKAMPQMCSRFGTHPRRAITKILLRTTIFYVFMYINKEKINNIIIIIITSMCIYIIIDRMLTITLQ